VPNPVRVPTALATNVRAAVSATSIPCHAPCCTLSARRRVEPAAGGCEHSRPGNEFRHSSFPTPPIVSATVASSKDQRGVVHLGQLGLCTSGRRCYRGESQVHRLRQCTRLQFTKDLIKGLPGAIVVILIESGPKLIAECAHGCKGRRLSKSGSPKRGSRAVLTTRQKFLVARQGSKPSQRQLRRLMLNPLSYATDWPFSGRF
jgi:hypothetical protein